MKGSTEPTGYRYRITETIEPIGDVKWNSCKQLMEQISSSRTWENNQSTLGKLAPKAAIMAIVEEQTNAAELDNPEPT